MRNPLFKTVFSGSLRVIRGGCWVYSARYVRVSDRNSYVPTSTNFLLGFRLFRSME